MTDRAALEAAVAAGKEAEALLAKMEPLRVEAEEMACSHHAWDTRADYRAAKTLALAALRRGMDDDPLPRAAMGEEVQALRRALVNHNDVLRSCHAVVARRGADTNWDTLSLRIGSVLAFHHEEVNAARDALDQARMGAGGGA